MLHLSIIRMIMIKKNTFIFPVSFILLLILLASCSTQRKIIKAPIKEEGADYLFKKLKEPEQWLKAKAEKKAAPPKTAEGGKSRKAAESPEVGKA